jgi:hypothetical protein
MLQAYILTKNESENIELITKRMQERISEVFHRTQGALDHCDMSIYVECCDLIGKINYIRRTLDMSEVNL